MESYEVISTQCESCIIDEIVRPEAGDYIVISDLNHKEDSWSMTIGYYDFESVIYYNGFLTGV